MHVVHTTACTTVLPFRFLFANVGWPSSRTDSHILKQTDLFRNVRQYVGSGYYLVADAGFAAYNWLVTPYSKAACSGEFGGECKDYNFNQASTRVVIEQVTV